MKVVARRDKLHFSDLLCIYIYAYVTHIYICFSKLSYYRQLLMDPIRKSICKIYSESLHIYKS